MFKIIAEWICLVLAWVLVQVCPVFGMNFALTCHNFFHGSKKSS
jgi:hypothetical protein